MKIIRVLGRNIRDAFRSVFRNFSLSAASISCITITLIIVALSILSSYNVENFAKLMKQDFTIVVFIKTDVNEERLQEIEKEINKLENVESFTFESKEEIASSMMETSDTFQKIIAQWEEGENPLQDTFLIKVKKIDRISQTAKQIKKIEGVDLVKYGEGIVERLLKVFDLVEQALIIMVLLLVFVTAFLITNTIKLTIFSRRKEIEIMRLVGASNLNIQLPFLIEGLILGILGSLIPIGLVIYGYTALYKNFGGQLFSPFVKLVQPEPFIYILSCGLIIMGIIVGMMGSVFAVRKYLRI
ncbi:MAG: permease-like cell division protein FtsX [Bacilli bacterium]|jgi:cell division transport system permease protein